MPKYRVTTPEGKAIVTAPEGADEGSIFGFVKALGDSGFWKDVGSRLQGALESGVQDVFPTKPYENIVERARAGEKGVLSKEWGANPELRNSVLNTALGALTVYHGSPHKFDRFDLSKIGTGEGAQAYGHGLYMAESPGVAGSYQKRLSQVQIDEGEDSISRFLNYGKSNPRRIDMNAPSNTLTPAEMAVEYLHMNKGSTIGAMEDLRGMIEANTPDIAKYQQALKTLQSGKIKPSLLREEYGNLYKADIPDEAVARMLDWDKPLSQQHPDVLKALQSNPRISAMAEKYPSLKWGDMLATGEFGSADQASKQLAQAGIPGIKYADAMSRGKEAGTSNYVLFSDELPRILERNGVAIGNQPWAPGEWKLSEVKP